MGLESPPHKVVWNESLSSFVEVPIKLPDDAPSLSPSFWFNTNPLNEAYRERAECKQDHVVLVDLYRDKANGF